MAHRRPDSEWIEERLRAADTRIVPVWRSKNLVSSMSTGAVFLPADVTESLATDHGERVFLGVHDGAAFFALGLDDDIEAPAHAAFRDGQFVNIHRSHPLFDGREAAILAYARAIINWHRSHRFCGRCGARTVSVDGGHLRRCKNPACEAKHFPRTDPAIIVLVTSGDFGLLGRQPDWPAGIYSTIAGFVEPGESLEEAVHREVYEETGVSVDTVEFHSSQPWPFPTSIMLGFTGSAPLTPVRPDSDELEDARWFSREEVVEMAAESGPLRLPRKISIARRLIDQWIDAR